MAEAGEAGEHLKLRLELKLIADVGIVGAPNAGKSSLLAALTAARPKIAAYPFTTIEPNLGVAEHRDQAVVLVDIPGLIEGAHEGVGLGHDFLRHIERTRVIVHVVDAAEETAVQTYEQIRAELRLFDSGLAAKPEVVAANKMDVAGADSGCKAIEQHLRESGPEVHCISAAGRQGLGPLLDSVTEMLGATHAVVDQSDGEKGAVPVLRPRPADEGVEVRKRGRRYLVFSKPAARIAAMLDESNWAARTQFYAHLRKLGVITALEKAGIRPGEVYKVGKLEWEWT